MDQLHDMQHACRIVALQGVMLGLLREAQDEGEGADALTVTAERSRDGSITIDLTYSAGGVPVAGEGA